MKLMSKRPSDLQDEGPLYLTPKILNEGEKWQELEVWFKRVPLGVNLIDKLMASIVQNTRLNKTEKQFYKPFIKENYSDKIAQIWSKRNTDHGNYWTQECPKLGRL